MPSATPPTRDSETLVWHYRPGRMLAIRHLRTRHVPVVVVPLDDLLRLSQRAIRLALRLFPRFLARADLTFPVIIAGRGW